jgi:hypothetical protein
MKIPRQGANCELLNIIVVIIFGYVSGKLS